MMETHFLIHTEHTTYRVRPNPDIDEPAAKGGVVLEWRDGPNDKWQGYFFISPEAAEDVARAIMRLMKEPTE